ncbi:MAG: bifunctional oligoribonuclease/PAP phosphatase NrnA [Bacilli bacterium]|nr:bifunctional oligoribonuclease/PAP phosphatase NrnA [Bacilli bacterium]
MANTMYKKLYRKIRLYDEIVIVRHIGPDPDAISSQLALRDSIRETFPNKKVYAVGSGVHRFKYIGQLDKLDEQKLVKPLLIVVDLPNLSRIDGASPQMYKEIIKIDHHPVEDHMGEVEIVDVRASSAAEIIAEIILNTKLKLNKAIAEKLFIGIVSDSNRFLLSTSKTLRIVAELIEKGHINIKDIYPKLYERPLSEVRFQAHLAQNLTVTENGFAYIKIGAKEIEEYHVDSSTASNMINDFNYIEGIYVWTFITLNEKNNQYKINIRSRGPIINEIAAKYNGGGHKLASGVRTESEKDIENLLKDLDEACKNYKESVK